ncbi:hypothetical protein [Streptomyces aurantiogriseus]|uniref:Lipoprotein n=1 Tax=Streptomyces aurantiogriseus TaxID=66870 RepID=A0A918F9U9_9ACTN|nr:hypothetical protein [Streptomyces aurantiogriseus]GGR14913.1 lipoprotein [Streptomyces aurantiogriseus]
MPFPPPSRTPSGPRRRTLLASAAGAALLVGCSSRGDSGEESSGGSPSVAEQARARAARDSAGLVERYDAVLTVHPALAARLTPLRAEVVRHVTAFGGAGSTASPTPSPSSSASSSSAPSSSASGSASASADPSAPPAAVPAGEKDALSSLAAAERALADRRVAALVNVPGELARLLASVAAAGAAHAYLLTEGAR